MPQVTDGMTVIRALKTRIEMKIQPLIAAGFGLLMLTAAYASEPRYGRIAFSGPDSLDAQEHFSTDAAKVVLHVELLDIPEGVKLGATWVAEKTSVAPPNFRIDTAETVAEGTNEASFSMTKPDAGWPVGVYRVDLSIGGATVKSARFSVGD
jgi:hypothetical protein